MSAVAAAGGARRAFKLALVQLRVGPDKAENVARAIDRIRMVAGLGAEVVCLPEIFNSPYGNQHFSKYAEPVPDGPTCASLHSVAMETGVHLIGGSIPELDTASGRLYNTCVCYGPGDTEQRIPGAIYRKCHLFDIDIPGGIRFKESDTLSPGDRLQTWQTPFVKIGLGICYDVRFPRMAERLSRSGCDLLVYPGAFNTTTGPAHWELLARAQSVQNQVFTAVCSPASDPDSGGYVAHGHSLVVDPWGAVLADCGPGEGHVLVDIDLARCDQIRAQIPLRGQQRPELYC